MGIKKGVTPIWIYAPTREMAGRLAVYHRILPCARWLHSGNLDDLRGTEYPVIAYCGCLKLPLDIIEFLRFRYARILPLRCKHDPN